MLVGANRSLLRGSNGSSSPLIVIDADLLSTLFAE